MTLLKRRLRLLTLLDRVITIPDAVILMLTGGVGQVGNTNIGDNTITS